MVTFSESDLKSAVSALAARPERTPAALEVLAAVRQGLGEGRLRVAQPSAPEGAGQDSSDGQSSGWRVNTWVKTAMLLMSRLGEPVAMSGGPPGGSTGVELDTTPWRSTPPPECRIPTGSFVREGAYLAPGATCMPPSVLQTGCYVGAGAVLDSMVMVGAGAQIGAGAQFSCGSVIGGYIVPLDRLPTIVEDGVLVGSGSGIFDGAQIGQGAILLAGTQIVPALGLYDLRLEQMVPMEDHVLKVPAGAIVGMGTRPVGRSGAQVRTALILGKRHGTAQKNWELYADIPLLEK